MRRDGREFASGSDAPRRFSEAAAERPQLDRYVAPGELGPGEVRAIDDVPPADELGERPVRATVAHADAKRRL